MNFMPRDISQMKRIVLPMGVYNATVMGEEEKNGSYGPYLELKLKVFTTDLKETNLRCFLSNDEKGAFRLYRYMCATNRDYKAGQLKNCKGDKVWVKLIVRDRTFTVDDPSNKDHGKTIPYQDNMVVDFMTSLEAQDFLDRTESLKETGMGFQPSHPAEMRNDDMNDPIPF